MAPSQRYENSGVALTGNDLDIAIAGGAGIVAGDMLVAASMSSNGRTVTISGWDKRHEEATLEGQRAAIFTKVADGTENGTNITFAGSGGGWRTGHVVAVEDAAYDTSDLDVTVGVAPTVMAAEDDSFEIQFFADHDGAGAVVNPPAGLTTINQETGGAANRPRGTMASRSGVSAGSTGGDDWAETWVNWTAIATIILSPAAGGGGALGRTANQRTHRRQMFFGRHG